MIFDLIGKPLIAAFMSIASLLTLKALGQKRKSLVAVRRHKPEP